MELDWDAIGKVIGGLVVVGTGAWGVWLNAKKNRAESRADQAESDRDRSVADSQNVLYTQLTNRLETLENEVRSVRNELATERAHSRRLELHIWKLENVMRAANLEIPVFEDKQ